VSLHPGEEPVRGLLGRWLKREGLPAEAAELLAALNKATADADFAVGPSYLMRRANACQGDGCPPWPSRHIRRDQSTVPAGTTQAVGCPVIAAIMSKSPS
jgi:hypothetical protein